MMPPSGAADKGPFWEDEIKDIYAKAKYEGIDVAAMRMIIAVRKKERLREEEEQKLVFLERTECGLGSRTPHAPSSALRERSQINAYHA